MTFVELNNLFCDGEDAYLDRKDSREAITCFGDVILLLSIIPKTRRCANLPYKHTIISAHCITMLMNAFGKKPRGLWSGTVIV